MREAELTDREKILAGRKAVDAYREAHTQLYSKPWHRGIPEEHTPLLEKLVTDLAKLGYASTGKELKDKSPEILAKFWTDSDLLNIQEHGFIDKKDFENRATEADREALELKWN